MPAVKANAYGHGAKLVTGKYLLKFLPIFSAFSQPVHPGINFDMDMDRSESDCPQAAR